MKKGRHRRFEEARALKRSQDVDFDALFDSLDTGSSAEDDDRPATDADADDDVEWVDDDETERR